MSEKYRIAICLFGHLRTFHKTFESFSKHLIAPNQLDGYEIDIFIHTWDEVDHSTTNASTDKGVSINKSYHINDSIEDVKSIYNPALLSIEPQREIEDFIIYEKTGNSRRSVKGCLNLAYTIFRSNQLRETFSKKHKKIYEWVIMTRPDIIFFKDFRINAMFETFKKNNFNIPHKGLYYASGPFGWQNQIEDDRFISACDLIFFARPEVITIAASLYEDFENNIDYNDFYSMEIWWFKFWKKKALDTRKINYNYPEDCNTLRHTDPIYAAEIKTEEKKVKDKIWGIKQIKDLVKILPYFIAKRILKVLE